MENLLFCLNATVPVFMLMVLGFFFRKINLFDDPFVNKANKFVFTIALPVLVFQDLATTDFISSWDTRFVLFCFVITVVSIFIAFLILPQKLQPGRIYSGGLPQQCRTFRDCSDPEYLC